MSDFIKNNGGMLAVLGVAIVMLSAFADWRVGVKVEDALAAKGFATNDKISDIEKDIDETREQHRSDADRLDSKVERIVDILLEE